MPFRVTKIILSHALTGFICWYGVEKLFEKSIGISTLGISVLAMIYIATSALLNIPTGILADKRGRKYAILLAASALLLSTIIGGLAHSFWQYSAAVILWGLFYTSQNGAYESILYDTLKEESNEQAYARYSGISSSAFWMAIFLSSIVGAWAGNRFGLRTAFFLTIIPNLLNLVLVFYLYEPRRAKRTERPTSLSLAKQGFGFLKSSPQTLSIASVYLLLALVGWTTNEFGQLFFIELGFSIFIIGILNASSGLAQSIGNFFGYRFGKISARLTVLALMPIFIATFALPVKFRFVSTSLFMFLVLLRNIFYIANNAALHHTLPSSIRATTVSSLGMISDGVLIIGYLGFGLISRMIDVRAGYLAIAAYGFILYSATRLYARSNHFKDSIQVMNNPAELILVGVADSVPH